MISGRCSSGSTSSNTPQHFQLLDYEETRAADGTRIFAGKIAVDGTEQSVSGRGNGLISSVVATLADSFGLALEVADYTEHAMGAGSDARAAAYVECRRRWQDGLGRGHRRRRRHRQRPRGAQRGEWGGFLSTCSLPF